MSLTRTLALWRISIRTSFDLFLTALNLPRGSEIIFSSVTIKDMVQPPYTAVCTAAHR